MTRKLKATQTETAKALLAALDRLPVAFALFDSTRRLAAWNARLTSLGLFPKSILKQGAPLAEFLRRDPGLKRTATKPHDVKLAAGRVLQATCKRVPPGQLLLTYEDVTEARRAHGEATEALAQQAATAEILKVISASAADTQPVFEAIVQNALRLIGAVTCILYRFDGKMLSVLADNHSDPKASAVLRGRYPAPARRGHLVGRTVLSGREMHTADVLVDARFPANRNVLTKVARYRAALAVPLLRDGKVIGAVGVARPDPRAFSKNEIRLLRTFADQAVIAIENVRLFNETREALEQQTASSEILGVISSSPTDLAPVFDAILHGATRLCDAHLGLLNLYDGESLRTVAQRGGKPAFAKWVFERGAFKPVTSMARMIAERRPIQTADLKESPGFREGSVHPVNFVELGGARSYLTVPLLKDDRVMGAIAIYRPEVRPFTEKQIELVKTFANQAVIAIENVRLFNETKNALARQTATAEILRVLGGSMTDTQPVFDAIVKNCHELFKDSGVILRLVADGNLLARANIGYPIAEAVPIDRTSAIGASVIDGRTIHLPDLDEAAKEFPRIRQLGLKYGFRSGIYAPLMHGGKAIGAMSVLRRELSAFDDKDVQLLNTFADQAVIAIENVRLFNGTKEALERQTATAEILKVIAGSPTDVQPVFNAIAASALRLFGGHSSTVTRVVGDMLHLAAFTATSEAGNEGLQSSFPRPLSSPSLHTRAALSRNPAFSIDFENDPEMPPEMKAVARARGVRSQLNVPMLREGISIGAIAVTRTEPGQFTDHQINLLETFADQAVIAIENVRLFNETKDALERQTATAEILRVIASSPSDVQPVFDTIVQNAGRVCDSEDATLVLRVGEEVEIVAHWGPIGSGRGRRRPLSRESVMGRAILDCQPVHIDDVTTAPGFELARQISAQPGFGHRTVLGVPLLQGGRATGSLLIRRTEIRPFSENQIGMLQTFADQAVIAIENVRLFNETKEALERQTATAEILKVISGSPTDTQPIFDAIVQSAVRLCNAVYSAGLRLEGGLIHLVAHHNWVGDGLAVAQRLFPLAADRDHLTARAIRENRIIHLQNMQSDPQVPASSRELAIATGYQTILIVPMLREDRAIGAIVVAKAEGPFSEKQIALLTTFADQAVIAIENVRLFNETKEALEQQTATAEILKVIASSPSDVQPVFDAVAESAARLCDASDAIIQLRQGDVLLHAAHCGSIPYMQVGTARPITRGWMAGRAVLEGRQIHVHDLQAEEEEFPEGSAYARKFGYRTALLTPLLREGQAIGTIQIRRTEVRPFSDKQIALLQTFADQAVIAIENVRLFNETKEALERQTATAEILKVISSSPTDLQPVFDAILENATRLCDAHLALLGLYDGEKYQTVAQRGASAEFEKWVIGRGRFKPAGGAGLDEMTAQGQPVHFADYRETPAYRNRTPMTVKMVELGGLRTYLAVPMLKEGRVVGGITIYRPEVRPFTQKQIDLVSTFASQAVIAIENVRLFKELQSRTEALTRSVGQLTALGEVGQAISSTLDLETVLKTIVSRAVQLTGLDGGSIYEYDERAGEFHLRATENADEEYLAILRRTPIRKGEGAVGRAALTGEPTQIPDVRDQSYQSRLRDAFIRAGYRAVLVVPLRREEHVIGALSVTRKTPGPFAPEVVELLKTFATQSAMAIQNARLFREIAEKGKQLEEASQHKSQFLASMSHELRTPLNAILGFNEMILGQVYGEVPQDMQEPLTDIQTSGKHLLRLINNVLDLAKIEAGRMELSLQDYSVNDIVESVRSTLRPLAADKGLEFLASVPNDMPLAYGDPGRITQCLMNLAGNSLKFTKAGKVEISVQAKGELLVYKVTDTGIGIPPDKIESLFTEFKQTDATIASEYGGTGLGLSISRKFVEMHGGRIWVESEIGKGSAFIIEVPLRVKTT